MINYKIVPPSKWSIGYLVDEFISNWGLEYDDDLEKNFLHDLKELINTAHDYGVNSEEWDSSLQTVLEDMIDDPSWKATGGPDNGK